MSRQKHNPDYEHISAADAGICVPEQQRRLRRRVLRQTYFYGAEKIRGGGRRRFSGGLRRRERSIVKICLLQMQQKNVSGIKMRGKSEERRMADILREKAV